MLVPGALRRAKEAGFRRRREFATKSELVGEKRSAKVQLHAHFYWSLTIRLTMRGLLWQSAIGTIRYTEESFDRLALKQPIVANIRHAPRSALDLPDPFRTEWAEGSRRLEAVSATVPPSWQLGLTSGGFGGGGR